MTLEFFFYQIAYKNANFFINKRVWEIKCALIALC